jgi:hypothetical protein
MACCRSGHNFVHEQIKSWDMDKRLLIYNCEDMLPANYDTEKYAIASQGLLIDTQLETIKLIVVRDLLNWWASYLKWMSKTNFLFMSLDKVRNAFTIWNAHVLEANIPRYMDPTLYCEYDDFRTSMSNRIALCNKIGGCQYNEKMLNYVPSSGGGSSFDGTSVKGSEMKTDYRYKQILDTPLRDAYVRGLQDNMLSVGVYERFFSLTNDQKKFINRIS